MSKFISNSFSINILPLLELGIVRVKKISPDMIPKDVESAIGHEDTARVVSGILGFEVKPTRVSIKLTESDVLYVAQYTGPRLRRVQRHCRKEQTSSFSRLASREEGCRGCRGYDTGSCQTCKLSFWLSGTPLKDC